MIRDSEFCVDASSLEAHIEDALDQALGDRGQYIQVSIQDRSVHLSGVVSDALSRERAGRVARQKVGLPIKNDILQVGGWWI